MHSVISIYISVADASIHVSVYLRRSYVMRESVDELKTKKESAIELSTRRQSYTNTSIHSHTHTCAMYEWSVCMNERVGAPPDIPFPTRMLDWDRCTNYVECAFTYQAKANMFYFIIIAIHRAVSVGCRRLYTNTHTAKKLPPLPSTALCWNLHSPSSKSHSANFIHGSVLDLDDRTVSVALKFHSNAIQSAMYRIWFYVSCGVAKTEKKKLKKNKPAIYQNNKLQPKKENCVRKKRVYCANASSHLILLLLFFLHAIAFSSGDNKVTYSANRFQFFFSPYFTYEWVKML